MFGMVTQNEAGVKHEPAWGKQPPVCPKHSRRVNLTTWHPFTLSVVAGQMLRRSGFDKLSPNTTPLPRVRLEL